MKSIVDCDDWGEVAALPRGASAPPSSGATIRDIAGQLRISDIIPLSGPNYFSPIMLLSTFHDSMIQ